MKESSVLSRPINTILSIRISFQTKRMFENRNKIKYGPNYMVLIEMHEDRKGRERKNLKQPNP